MPEATWKITARQVQVHIGAIRTFHCTYPSYPTPLHEKQGAIERKLLTCGFSLRRKRKTWNMCPKFWPFEGLPKVLVFVSPDLDCWQERDWHTLDAWGPQKTKTKQVDCYNSRDISVWQIDTWWCSLVEKGKTLQLEIRHPSPEKTYPRKACEVPRISIWTDWWRPLSSENSP